MKDQDYRLSDHAQTIKQKRRLKKKWGDGQGMSGISGICNAALASLTCKYIALSSLSSLYQCQLKKKTCSIFNIKERLYSFME